MLCIISDLEDGTSGPGPLVIAPDDAVESKEGSGGSCTNGDIWTEGGGTRFPLRYA